MTKIMVVEDEKNLQLLYQQELTEDGYEVVVMSDGESAVEEVSKVNPDLVVLDVQMPGMDGLETLGKILSQDNTTPIILNTAFSHYKDNFMSWSADAYVVKSSDLTELKKEIQRVLKDRGKI